MSLFLSHHYYINGDSLMAQKVKNMPAIEETQVQSLGQEATLRRERQPTPVLAWRIPSTKEPGKLQSMGLQRVSHD